MLRNFGLFLDPSAGPGLASPAAPVAPAPAPGSPTPTPTPAPSPEVQAMIRAAVDAETRGLRENRDAALAEKRALREFQERVVGKLGGEDKLDEIIAIRERLAKDEMGKLLADGKYDEWFERRSAAMRKDSEKRIEDFAKAKTAAEKERDEARDRYRSKVLEVMVQEVCTTSGVVPTAIADVRRAAMTMFTLDDEGSPIMKQGDTVVFGKDGRTPKSLAEWLDEQKEPARHWWPPSQGAGAQGGNRAGGGQDAFRDGMTYDEYTAWRAKQPKFKAHSPF